MKSPKVKDFKIRFSKTQESLFYVLLDNNKKMEVPLWSFFQFVTDADFNLFVYAKNFNEWELLAKDLISLGYDFQEKLNEYIGQFTEEDIKEFSF